MAYTDLINREHQIANHIQEVGEVTVGDIVEKFSISASTARRILTRLAEVGVVERTHGGALWADGNSVEAPVFSRAKMHSAEKDHIATAAASMICAGETVILLAGTTINALAGKIKEKEGIKVITNSLPVLEELQPYTGIDIIFLGGMLNRKEQSFGGSLMGLYARELRADKLFFSVKGIGADHQLTLDDVNERDNFRLFMASARENIVLADGSKFNQSGTIALCSMDEVQALITDRSAPEPVLGGFSGWSTRVIVTDGGKVENGRA